MRIRRTAHRRRKPTLYQYTPGDRDLDGDVDLADYSIFSARQNGPRISSPATRGATGLDGDCDTDRTDLIAFQAHFTGAR